MSKRGANGSAARESRMIRAMGGIMTAIAVCCLAGATLAQGGRFSAALDLLAQFAPLWLAGAVLSLAYGLLFAKSGGRATMVTLGTLGVAASGALIVPELARPIAHVVPGPTTTTLKLIQFNTWDETLDPATSAAWIVGQRPDIVTIEEADPRIVSALTARGYHGARGFGHMWIFSRTMPIGVPAPLSAAEWHRMPPFARATFEASGNRFTVIATHLPEPIHPESGQARRMLVAFLRRYDPDRLIVSGDFNLAPWSFALRRMDGALALTRLDRALFTWPARLALNGLRPRIFPILPLDHIYAGAVWRLVSLRRGPALGSDHFPLVVVLAMPDGGAVSLQSSPALSRGRRRGASSAP